MVPQAASRVSAFDDWRGGRSAATGHSLSHNGENVKAYRICLVSSEGRIEMAQEIACEDDLDALAEAEILAGNRALEVWDGGRLVARVQVDNAPRLSEDRQSL